MEFDKEMVGCCNGELINSSWEGRIKYNRGRGRTTGSRTIFPLLVGPPLRPVPPCILRIDCILRGEPHHFYDSKRINLLEGWASVNLLWSSSAPTYPHIRYRPTLYDVHFLSSSCVSNWLHETESAAESNIMVLPITHYYCLLTHYNNEFNRWLFKAHSLSSVIFLHEQSALCANSTDIFLFFRTPVHYR